MGAAAAAIVLATISLKTPMVIEFGSSLKAQEVEFFLITSTDPGHSSILIRLIAAATTLHLIGTSARSWVSDRIALVKESEHFFFPSLLEVVPPVPSVDNL